MATIRESRRTRIKKMIRKRVEGTQERPRLSVFRSNTAIYAQIIDDRKGITIVSASSIDIDKASKSINIDKSKKVGLALAQKAKEKGVSKVAFDRNGYLYHGKVKALAEGAREGGLEF
jgi:large subunit ribosomal protein L18